MVKIRIVTDVTINFFVCLHKTANLFTTLFIFCSDILMQRMGDHTVTKQYQV